MTASGTGRLRLARRILWACVAVAALGLGVLAWQHRNTAISTLLEQSYAVIGGPFTLTDEDGQTLTGEQLKGRPFALYFGFTQCPDVCPTSMLEMASIMAELGAIARDFRVYFVTVDPERDPPDVLKAYTESFDPRIIGLTGTADQIAEVARAYRAFYRRVPTEHAYTMDHTATIYLMNAEGRLASTISYGEDHATAVDKVRRLIAGTASQ